MKRSAQKAPGVQQRRTIMETTSNDNFLREVACIYKGESYTVRDNGSVWRHAPQGRKGRPADNQWTRGKLNAKAGLEIASVPIHRIVATAFHGNPPSSEYVIYHIDTDKQNNRPENLRWITRLESMLLTQPNTARYIAAACGSIAAFLQDPSGFGDKFQEGNFKWLGAIDHQEAQASYGRLLTWAKADTATSHDTIDTWIFSRPILSKPYVEPAADKEDIASLTINAVQRDWLVPSEFPCCPQPDTEHPISAYAEKLEVDAIFCRNPVYTSVVFKSALSADRQSLYVLSASIDMENAIKPWTLAEVTLEKGLFVHTSLGSFFSPEGAEKRYCLAQELEWQGGDSIDDYC